MDNNKKRKLNSDLNNCLQSLDSHKITERKVTKHIIIKYACIKYRYYKFYLELTVVAKYKIRLTSIYFGPLLTHILIIDIIYLMSVRYKFPNRN